MLHVLSYCAALEYIYLATSWAVESFPLDVDHACSMHPNPVYLCTHVIHIRCAAMKGQRAPKQVSPWRYLLRQSLIRCSPWIVQTNWHGTLTLTSQALPTRSLNEARVWKKCRPVQANSTTTRLSPSPLQHDMELMLQLSWQLMNHAQATHRWDVCILRQQEVSFADVESQNVEGVHLQLM